jgi:hypothetical protein
MTAARVLLGPMVLLAGASRLEAETKFSCPHGQIWRVKKNACEPKAANLALFSKKPRTGRDKQTPPKIHALQDAPRMTFDPKKQQPTSGHLRPGKPNSVTSSMQEAARPTDSLEPSSTSAHSDDSTSLITAPKTSPSSVGPDEIDNESGKKPTLAKSEASKEEQTPENDATVTGDKIFLLLKATNVSDSEPHPMPTEVVAVEPWLSGLLYVKRSSSAIDLVEPSTLKPVGTLKAQSP